MTTLELADILRHLQSLFPGTGDLPEAALTVWRKALDGYPPEEVKAAVGHCYEESRFTVLRLGELMKVLKARRAATPRNAELAAERQARADAEARAAAASWDAGRHVLDGLSDAELARHKATVLGDPRTPACFRAAWADLDPRADTGPTTGLPACIARVATGHPAWPSVPAPQSEATPVPPAQASSGSGHH